LRPSSTSHSVSFSPCIRPCFFVCFDLHKCSDFHRNVGRSAQFSLTMHRVWILLGFSHLGIWMAEFQYG
jgi:hypothetical protein